MAIVLNEARKAMTARATAGRLAPLFLFSSLLPGFVFGESDSSRPSSGANFSVRVDTVLLSVRVYFPDSEEHQRLTPSDFLIYEEGVPRDIVYFSEGNAPLSVVLLIDCSWSMQVDALDAARRAALQFIRQSHPDTEFSLVTFNDQVRRVVDFTYDRGKITQGLDSLRAHGGTRLYDGVQEAVHDWSNARNRTQVVILLTDGRDENSRTSLADIQDLLQRSDVILFPCGLYNPAYRRLFLNDEKYFTEPEIEKNLNPVWVLKRLAKTCATRPLFLGPDQQLHDIFAEIIRDLGQRYTVGFVATALPEVRYRRIEVKLRSQGQAQIQVRQGFLR